jgi:hypothetical protein
MPNTEILEPLQKNDITDKIRKNYDKIKALLEKFYKSPKDESFQNILEQLSMSESDYFLAIRSTLKRPTVFLKRTSMEVSLMHTTMTY